MERLSQKDFVEQRWKNGKGITFEIARAEQNEWRLSLARMSGSGPFSAFEGCERVLTVVRGAGISLGFNGAEHIIRPAEPFRFSGGAGVWGACLDGPVENLNLIFDPRRMSAETSVGQAQALPQIGEGLVLAYLLEDHHKLRAGDVLRGSASGWAEIGLGATRVVRAVLRQIRG